MNVIEALRTIQQLGAVEGSNGKLKLRFPRKFCADLQPAIYTLERGKTEALQLLASPPTDRSPKTLQKPAPEVAAPSVPVLAPTEFWPDWCNWKASALNRLFQEQGVIGEPGNITAATIRHGETITVQAIGQSFELVPDGDS